MVVYTEAVQFKVDSKLVDFIEKKLSKIDQFFDRIINAKVVLKLENTGQVPKYGSMYPEKPYL